MDLRTYLMIKQAGNPVNKLKLKSFKTLTDPDYVDRALTAQVDRSGIPEDDKQGIVNEGHRAFNTMLYGQPTAPDAALSNPVQYLKDRGMYSGFGDDAKFNGLVRLRRSKGLF